MIDTFYWDMRNFFSEKLVSEIHKSKHLSVCNVADSFYAVFPHVKSSDGQCAVVVTTDNMRRIVEDPAWFSTFYASLSPEQKDQCCLALGKSNIDLIRQWKAQTQLNGPDSSIDLEFEQQLGVRQGELKHGKTLN